MASKTLIALYFLIALAVAASVLEEEDAIDNSDALDVEENGPKKKKNKPTVCKRFIFLMSTYTKQYNYRAINLKQ